MGAGAGFAGAELSFLFIFFFLIFFFFSLFVKGARRTVPYVVFLEVSAGGGQMGQCTGSIIDETNIITAAHCVADEDTNRQNAFSATVVISNYLRGRAIFRGTGRVTVHSGYAASGDTKHDMAMIVLSSPLSW